MAKHLLSICIPTNGVARWVIPALKNIYSLEADESIFEVVVADNGAKESELTDSICEFYSHSNFRYIKTNAEGFYNIIQNFLEAKGDYMIKLNHRCILHKGMIEYIYDQAEKYYVEKPLMFFSNGNLGDKKVLQFNSFNDYLYHLSFWSSLSEGLFFWKEDLNRVSEIKFAKMSPNVSLMFDSKYKNKFVIDDNVICHDIQATNKYGYNLFDTFAVLYLDIVNEVRATGDITKKTFIKIKKDILSFLTGNYVAMVCCGDLENFSLDGMKESLMIYYSQKDYLELIWKTRLYHYPRIKLKNIFKFK